MRLRALDSDSGPSNLTYSVLSGPTGGALYLRNAGISGTNHDLLLRPGAVFTQSDVNHGRVVFVHGGDASSPAATSFNVSLHDENPAHSTSTNTIALNIYRPDREPSLSTNMVGTSAQVPMVAGFPTDQQAFVSAYLLSRDKGYIVLDAASDEGIGRSSPFGQGVPHSVGDNEHRHMERWHVKRPPRHKQD